MEQQQSNGVVVICFKFSNFAYANTVDFDVIQYADSCYLL